jgi:hypothetical protein
MWDPLKKNYSKKFLMKLIFFAGNEQTSSSELLMTEKRGMRKFKYGEEWRD